MITHHRFTTYYPQGNVHAKSTNNNLKQILTFTLVNVNQNDWDVMLPTALWAY